MNNFWIVILVIFEIGQFADDCNALQHNLFYGNCVYDNNTMPIYTQLVTMDNLRPPTAVRPRRWYDYVLHPFRRHSTTPSPTSSPPSASFRHGNIINTTIVYPPHGHNNPYLIKCIQVIDNLSDGSGAFPLIVEGGVNQTHARILIKSQPGGKINDKITIFAYRPTSVGWKVPPLPKLPPLPAHPNGVQHSQPSARPTFFPWPNFQ